MLVGTSYWKVANMIDDEWLLPYWIVFLNQPFAYKDF